MKREWKKMTVQEFNEAFGCDVIEIVRKQLGNVEGKSKRVGIVATTAAAPGGGNLKTPAVKFAGRPPMTRTVRKGERVM